MGFCCSIDAEEGKIMTVQFGDVVANMTKNIENKHYASTEGWTDSSYMTMTALNDKTYNVNDSSCLDLITRTPS